MTNSKKVMSGIKHLVIMGVSGCGKTTVAGIIADRLGIAMAEADDFHSKENVAKMEAGHPLNDDDRWPWLRSIRDWMNERAAEGSSTTLTCSALKRSYRELLNEAEGEVIFVHLDGDKDLILRRMSARTDHFMPTSLLDSQLATLERLEPDENGFVVDVDQTPQEIADEILQRITGDTHPRMPGVNPNAVKIRDSVDAKADVGVYGLGVMGTSLARNFARHGFSVAVYNYETDITNTFVEKYGNEGNFIPAFSEAEFAGALRKPRVAALMVTAGKVTQLVSEHLAEIFDEGDVIVDMGNSFFRDTIRREKEFAEQGINFIGCGTSGGQEGALLGPSLMVGGSEAGYDRLKPMYEAIAAKADDGESCCVHAGSDGAGHFVKMVHNGIEYADMQLIAESYNILRNLGGLEPAEIGTIFDQWNNSELGSYLIEISADILQHRDPETNKPFVDVVSDVAGQKGTGLWTVQEGTKLGVPITAITEATLARLLSTHKTKRNNAIDVFGTSITSEDINKNKLIDAVKDALYASKIIAYSQGFDALMAGAAEFDWSMDYGAVARAWRKGCIIRAKFLERISDAFAANPDCNLLMAEPFFADAIKQREESWRNVVSMATSAGVPVPAFASSLSYFDGLRADRQATSLIQCQRDYFGAHTYQRVDKEGTFHTEWTQDERPERRIN